MQTADQTIFPNIMFLASNVTSQAKWSLHHEKSVLGPLIGSYSYCSFMCTLSLRQYSRVGGKKNFLHPHNKCHCWASVKPVEKQNSCSWPFLPNECKMNSIHTDIHTARPSRSERLASFFFQHFLFFCSSGPPPAMCSLFQRSPEQKAGEVCVVLPVLL